MRTAIQKTELYPDEKSLDCAQGKLRALYHKFRLKIIKHLMEVGTVNVTDLYVKFRHDQSSMSQHLAILRHAGYVITDKVGKEVFYSINEAELRRIINIVNNFE
jgi:DNA-binding transcriptional ArsR family regulator